MTEQQRAANLRAHLALAEARRQERECRPKIGFEFVVASCVAAAGTALSAGDEAGAGRIAALCTHLTQVPDPMWRAVLMAWLGDRWVAMTADLAGPQQLICRRCRRRFVLSRADLTSILRDGLPRCCGERMTVADADKSVDEVADIFGWEAAS